MLQIITESKVRPEFKMPEGRRVWSPNPGLVLFAGTLWEVNLRELYDRLYHGRIAPHVVFRLLEGAEILAAAGPAIKTGTWPTGTNLVYENRGRVQGKGGNGGKGGSNGSRDGLPGGDGGDAFLIEYDLTLDNTDGEVFAGGGGGGGGAARYDADSRTDNSGGGGGGGAGSLPGAGGAAGTTTGAGITGSPGSAGTTEAGGAGGVGGGTLYKAGDGGDGGGIAASGDSGTTPGGSFAGSPGLGGSPGSAIVESGGTVTITGGNNSTQIKGA